MESTWQSVDYRLPAVPVGRYARSAMSVRRCHLSQRVTAPVLTIRSDVGGSDKCDAQCPCLRWLADLSPPGAARLEPP